MSLSSLALAAIVNGMTISSVAAGEPGISREEALQATVRQVVVAEDQFWRAFNQCDAAGMAHRLTEDVEFYHDREGGNSTRAKVVASMMAGPCDSSSANRVRREALPDGGLVHLLEGGFALATGEHRFLITGNDGIERHDSIARYSVLWQDTHDGWQMKRVVSFDHRPDLPNLVPKVAMPGELRRFEGEYDLGGGETIAVKLAENTLVLGEGERAMGLVFLGEGRFGTEGRWLQFHFDGSKVEIFDEGKQVASGRRRER